MGKQSVSDIENSELVQPEAALTAYQIASAGQSESDTEYIEIVQRELRLHS
jgi:hypothetical protein